MNNPCKECIVKAMCQLTRTCDPAIDYMRAKIMAFKPPGSPISRSYFLSAHSFKIREKPTRSLELTLLTTNKRDMHCLVDVVDYEIVSIRRVSHGKSM